MLDIILAISPIFFVILTGHVLCRAQLFGTETWTAIGNICFYLLFPCLLIKTVATADLADLPFTELTIVMIGTITLISTALIALKEPFMRYFEISNSAYTSIFQGITRWHGFMAITIVAALYGTQGVTIIAVAIAIMVPLLNAINVTVLEVWGDHPVDEVTTFKSVIIKICKNPFIIACMIGAFINLSGIGLAKPIIDALAIMGNGALGFSLLAIGAGLRMEKIYGTKAATLAGVLLRLILMPLIMLILTLIVGLDGLPQTCAVIAAAVPTASSSYVMAQKMGGDKVLMANIITLQVIVAAITLPLAIWLSEIL